MVIEDLDRLNLVAGLGGVQRRVVGSNEIASGQRRCLGCRETVLLRAARRRKKSKRGDERAAPTRSRINTAMLSLPGCASVPLPRLCARHRLQNDGRPSPTNEMFERSCLAERLNPERSTWRRVHEPRLLDELHAEMLIDLVQRTRDVAVAA